jgi:phenylalanyl-tRNA synthetase beta chain
MGGRESEITDQTSNVLLECAYFEPRGIRRSARRLGLHTDSSYRFERGVGYAHLSQILDRAAGLLCELASGERVQGQLFVDGAPAAVRTVKLREARMNQLLGIQVPWARACDILNRLGFKRTTEGASDAVFEVPSFRPDVELEADLIEEVARIVGLSQIPTRLPAVAPQAPTASGRLPRAVRDTAAQLGLSEAITYSFVSEADLKKVRAEAPTVRLLNPLSEERNVMTTSLLPGLLEVVRRSRRRGERNLQVFSVATRFLAPLNAIPAGEAQQARPRAAEDVGTLPEERLSFAAVLAGDRPSYLCRADEVDVFDAKGIAVELIERLTGYRATVVLAGPSDGLLHLHPRGAAILSVDGQAIGCLGPLHPDVELEFDLDGGVQIIELDLVQLESVGKRSITYQPIPRLPSVTRDIAVEAAEELAAGTLLDTIRSHAGVLCESVHLFDVFRGKGMPDGRRSLAFRVVYRAPNAATEPDKAKTLTDKEVDQQHQRVIQAVEKLGVSLRA